MRVKATIDFEDLIGALVDRYIQPLILKVDAMSQQVTDLQAAVTALTQAVASTVSNEAALKQKLDAAVADNVAKAAQITDLQAQLAAAQAGQADPADAASIVAATATIQQQSQALNDAATANSPSN